jgi:hypothetical protein
MDALLSPNEYVHVSGKTDPASRAQPARGTASVIEMLVESPKVLVYG